MSPSKKPTLKSKPSTSKLAEDPWEWDGQSHALATTASPLSPATTQPKLQKKRSALAVPLTAPVSKPGPSGFVSALGSGPSTSTSTSEDSEAHPSTSFPTLDHSSIQVSPQTIPHTGRKRPSTPLNDSGHTANTNSPRRAHTPRRAPTPGTPPPSVSMQTQLASMKGALEAARLREEKMRADIKSLNDQLDMSERNARTVSFLFLFLYLFQHF
ncbi:hypothetical protein BDQ17DRAFT_402096 [Cyathus striatus]|nr:hypothetical protein BDQ17DRAFT_402096 [Cyathus striatus]